MNPIPTPMHPPFCCDYTPRLQGGDTLAETPRHPHPALTKQQDPGISQPRFPPNISGGTNGKSG